MDAARAKRNKQMDDIVGYIKEKRTINMILANIYSILILIFTAIFSISIYNIIWKQNSLLENIKLIIINSNLISATILITGILLHEILHGIVFSIFAEKGYKSIKFGILWKTLTPYCHCKEPLIIREYIIAALTPTIILGLFPLLIALLIGNIELLLFSIIFIAAGAGDLMLVKSILKEEKTSLIYDLPTEVGYNIYRKV